MKRMIAALLALAFVVAATPAHAGHWVTEPVKWERSTAAAGTYQLYDVTTAAQAKVDTTQAFRVDNASLFPFPWKTSATAQDTTVLCKLVFYGDSTTASNVVFNTTTFNIQAKSGSNATGWQDLYTYSSLNTANQKYCEVPIWMNRAATITRDLYIDRTGDLSLFGNDLRVIVTWNGASVAVPTAKCKLVYWVND